MPANTDLSVIPTLGPIITLLLFMQPVSAQSAADCAAEADRAQRDAGGAGTGRRLAKGAVAGAIVGDRSKAAKRGAALGGGCWRSQAKQCTQ